MANRQRTVGSRVLLKGMREKKTAILAGRVGLVCALSFGALALWGHLAQWQPLPPDTALHNWSTAHRSEAATTVARALTWTGTGLVPYVLAVAAGLFAGRTRYERALTVLAAVLCLAIGQALRFGAMQLFARERPPGEDWATHASRYSFPSGHATTSALVAGVLILAVLLRGPARRRLAVLLIATWGFAVGLTRVYLGVHWFTDVLGGWLFAGTVVGLMTAVTLVAAPHRRPQEAKVTGRLTRGSPSGPA